RVLHVADLIDFGSAPAEMEAQHRNAERVHALRVDFAIALLIGNHFSAPCKVDERAVLFPDRILQLLAVALVARALTRERAEPRQFESAADFDMVPAWEMLRLIVVEPPGHIHVHAADAVAIVPWQIRKRRHEAAHG